MDTYSILRQIADSWVLLMMFGFFLGCILWAFRPGSRPLHDDAARLIFSPEPEQPLQRGAKREAGQ
ncbi:MULTISPECIES: CcoQ/FixQ family Cbb3-type cytochrome c oxidase assembly chaperone [Limimaricola]|uniref:Cytochrome c oxidase subunit CcoQ n=2 Tax=Limimaricola TaxID=2211638 RepID=A0A017HF67_9RHOB|nr:MULTISPECIES: CcoQ/FixQ family Cbb3-type cytochrome c oxidase assembly chaperone [Limimaricola]EYD73127.1 Cytochrome c oxidase subunit CcoQ [Limimaricola hongkongensis DSM 17492]SDE37319.1 cytochrome c oxidase cbb3-type subunit 4 [Limimaricola pyoseonensis]